MGGVSGGPFILAKAGLLSGRRCTVHWEHLPALHEAFPDVDLTRSLFELDGDRITCSGGVAGLDMMVALITRDHGYESGAAVSDWFLHTDVRDGTRPQRMDLRFRLGIADGKLLRALRAMESRVERPLSRQEIAGIAGIAGISLRQLERSFRAHLGRGVHEHYRALRLARSRQLLASNDAFGSRDCFSDGFQFSKPVLPGIQTCVRMPAARNSAAAASKAKLQRSHGGVNRCVSERRAVAPRCARRTRRDRWRARGITGHISA